MEKQSVWGSGHAKYKQPFFCRKDRFLSGLIAKHAPKHYTKLYCVCPESRARWTAEGRDNEARSNMENKKENEHHDD